EESMLSTDCRGFLTFLEQAGALPPALRELVIERACATDSALSLSKLKVIVLMVMWRHQHSLDTLLLEELLAADDDEDGENRLYHGARPIPFLQAGGGAPMMRRFRVYDRRP